MTLLAASGPPRSTFAEILAGQVRSQQAECDELEGEFTGVTWLLRVEWRSPLARPVTSVGSAPALRDVESRSASPGWSRASAGRAPAFGARRLRP